MLPTALLWLMGPCSPCDRPPRVGTRRGLRLLHRVQGALHRHPQEAPLPQLWEGGWGPWAWLWGWGSGPLCRRLVKPLGSLCLSESWVCSDSRPPPHTWMAPMSSPGCSEPGAGWGRRT